MQVQTRLPPPSPPPKRTTTNYLPTSPLLLSAALVLLSLPVLLLLLRSPAPSPTCLLPSSTPSHPIPIPHVSFDRVPLLPAPTSPPHAPNWIVFPAPPSVPPSLLLLSRLPNFTLLAVADSRTPADWSLPNTLLLSLPLQARLPFRVLPRSPLSAAYLFAILHGARVVLDLDPHSHPAPLPLPFDLDPPLGVPLLQFPPDRTVLNPFVHFGQRTVWPRGLPLHSVPSSVPPEQFYTEIFGGRQFIQSGLSDGLPDVDSLFYRTRKSRLDTFDIRFDPAAPKVALPPGTMAPVNSLNTLFLSPAFWGLMMPATVGRGAADVVRGYWAQRILWEIGGYVAVYPPSVYRPDRGAEAMHPFAEERDLHVDAGRLVEFLVNWRSSKPTLFERILDLSYAMAVEGFWGQEDVLLTADWLQDLMSVGYQQPRLMSLEIDRPRGVFGHGDKKEFKPRSIPSVHLGVEEVGDVGPDIEGLIKWRKYFGNVVLVMYCKGEPERTAIEWRLLYGRIFKTVIILGGNGDEELGVDRVDEGQVYKYLPKIFKQFSGAEGFMFLHDNMVLNYWNLVQSDKTKLWIADKVPGFWNILPMEETSDWIGTQTTLLKKVLNSLPINFLDSYKEGVGEDKLVICGSELFYVPRRFVHDFSDIVQLVGDIDLHHKIAVPLLFMAMDSPENFDSDTFNGIIYETNPPSNSSYSSYYSPQAPAVYPCDVHDEPGFIKLIRLMAFGDPLLMEVV